MFYKSNIYQLNSMRLGLIDEDQLYGKPSIFFTCASQENNVKLKIKKYIDLHMQSSTNIIALPFDHDGNEPGDNYDIISYYENELGIDFFVSEKLDVNHIFFKDFGTPDKNFTEYHFDKNNKHIGKQ